MKSASRYIACLSAAAVMAAMATPSYAQLGNLRNVLPGAGRASASTPEAFVAEATETTKLVMIAAALIASAASESPNKDALKAQIDAIETASSPGDLQAQKAQFDANIATINQNAADAEQLQAIYDRADARQKQLMLTAAYNFSIGMIRNADLAQQAPGMIRSVGTNPMQVTRLGQLRTLGGLLTDQVQATRSMAGPMRALLSKGGVEVPANPSASDAKPVTDDLFG
ncbi:hypothetical protein [uncultured Brevundimonas sp.]|uniref:hypothetical protein n=1 Tax=uncultured Brevundimonas sp. TaxID=213418 RepID=UPI0026197C9E|nr:hypothetical protein [uncultured Brevundimonas sp.]